MKPVKVPKIRHVPTSKLDAVALPHAGASYNPSYQSHQKFPLRAVKQEEKHVKKIEKVEKATSKMFPTIDKTPTEESAHRMSEEYETHQELWREGMNNVSDQFEFL